MDWSGTFPAQPRQHYDQADVQGRQSHIHDTRVWMLVGDSTHVWGRKMDVLASMAPQTVDMDISRC